MGFSTQKYWSELPCPPSGNLPDPGIESESLMSPALAGGFFTTSTTWEAPAGVTEKNKYDSILDLFLNLTRVFYCFCYKLVTKRMLPVA